MMQEEMEAMIDNREVNRDVIEMSMDLFDLAFKHDYDLKIYYPSQSGGAGEAAC